MFREHTYELSIKPPNNGEKNKLGAHTLQNLQKLFTVLSGKSQSQNKFKHFYFITVA